jgi:hypothetical protein
MKFFFLKRSEDLTIVNMKITVVWYLTSCSLIHRYQYPRRNPSSAASNPESSVNCQVNLVSYLLSCHDRRSVKITVNLSTKTTVCSAITVRVQISSVLRSVFLNSYFVTQCIKEDISKGFHIPRHVVPYFSQFLWETFSHPITRRFCPNHSSRHSARSTDVYSRPSRPIFCSISQIVTSRSSNNNLLPPTVRPWTLSYLKPLYHI